MTSGVPLPDPVPYPDWSGVVEIAKLVLAAKVTSSKPLQEEQLMLFLADEVITTLYGARIEEFIRQLRLRMESDDISCQNEDEIKGKIGE